ncbi:hypothetical protein ILUMI_23017 [Ignelater luminosus]|uniref:Glycerol-3-phosphate dehydrogenase n=1 Tax=Ignelater luminosus TaxID=2038154 RepID=A0A8K0C9J4_IGNLU|nr:hypothetical protein ILUMI_23017 [Ignelater luminosus]
MGNILKSFQNRPKNKTRLPVKRRLPTRDEQIKSLQTDCFDVLIIGGGATGAGCALDAVTRGLRTALVEYNDFSSATSSKSTKLIHGGVRYLQKAIMEMDKEQFNMVREALHERGNMLNSAPHLTRPLPIMLPVYTWWQLPYFWIGIKMYDLVAGFKNLKSSYVLSKTGALESFPMLKSEKLVGAIVYYDGQQDDARMNLAIALTAARYGATIANHVSVRALQKKPNEAAKMRVSGATLKDEITGNEWNVSAKCVINATGPFIDYVRKMDNPEAKEICIPSSGVHIVLPEYYSPSQMGLLDPATSDGRVIFLLPWQNKTIAGTTDHPCDLTFSPKPTEDEISFILKEIKNYFNPDLKVRRKDVLSAWSGIRGLIADPNKKNTQSLVRNHLVHVSESNLVTIAGGKWTTYRSMAKDTIDAAIQSCNLKPKAADCQTDGLLMEGARKWTPTLYIRLIQEYGLKREVAEHLTSFYGDKACDVLKLGGMSCPVKLHPDFPYIEEEIKYGIHEYAVTATDMIARRLRIAFLNVEAAEEILPRIVEIMGKELNWSEVEKQQQLNKAIEFLNTEMAMGKCKK